MVVLGLGGLIPPLQTSILHCLWAHFLGLQLGPLCTLVEIPRYLLVPTGLVRMLRQASRVTEA